MNGEAIFWSPGVTLDTIEKLVICKAYQFYRQNKTATARALGISIKTLDNKFERYEKEDAEATEAQKYEHERREEQLHRARFGHGAGFSNPYQSAPAGIQNGREANRGNGVEPSSHAVAKSPVPVPERQEIQDVLPSEAPPRRRKRTGS
jgi:hypothetical protein